VSIGQSRRRQPRADAQRNRGRLLTEADSVFRERGTDAPLEAIARQADVAIGTLYGHFPTRRALVAALLHDRNDELFQLGDRLLAEPSALRTLTEWMRAVARHAAAYRGLAAMLTDGVANDRSELHDSCLRMAGFTEKLTARARHVGAIRRDITAADVSALIGAAAWTAERSSAEGAERLLNLAVNGIRAPEDPKGLTPARHGLCSIDEAVGASALRKVELCPQRRQVHDHAVALALTSRCQERRPSTA